MQPQETSVPSCPLLSEVSSYNPKLAKAIREAAGPDIDSVRLNTVCIEMLTRHMVALLNTRQYDDPILDLVVGEDFSWNFEGVPAALTGREYIGRMREAATQNPEYFLEILEMDITIESENATEALGWVVLRTHGSPIQGETDQIREVTGQSKWKKDESGCWRWISLSTVRGNTSVGWEFG